MSDRWDDLRFNAAEGEWAARPSGDMRRCLADLLAERDALAAEVEQLRTIVDAVEDDLGDDYLAALTEGDDRG